MLSQLSNNSSTLGVLGTLYTHLGPEQQSVACSTGVFKLVSDEKNISMQFTPTRKFRYQIPQPKIAAFKVCYKCIIQYRLLILSPFYDI